MEEKTHRVIAGYLSLYYGIILIIGSLIVPFIILYSEEFLATKFDLAQAIFLIIVNLIVLYFGYRGYIFFKDKNKLLWYNSIFLLSQIPLSFIEVFFQIFYFDFWEMFYLSKLSLYYFVILGLAYGASSFINGKKLLKGIKLPSSKKIFGKSKYFLLISVISLLALITVDSYDRYLWSEYGKTAGIDVKVTYYFNDRILWTAGLLVITFFISFIMGIFVLLFRFTKYLMRKIKK